MTKHTQGIWGADYNAVESTTKDGTIIDIAVTSSNVVATLRKPSEATEADATLIAASPKLLEQHITDIALLQAAKLHIQRHDLSAALQYIDSMILSKQDMVKPLTVQK